MERPKREGGKFKSTFGERTQIVTVREKVTEFYWEESQISVRQIRLESWE